MNTYQHTRPGDYTVEIHYANDSADIALSNSHHEFYIALGRLVQAVPLTSFIVQQHEAPNVQDYDYEFVAKDGRDWSQVIRMDNINDPGMNFDVPKFWRVASEFTYHRAVRETVIHMINELGIYKIEVTWE